MAKLIGIDLGSSNTRIYLKGDGVILREPSLVSVCCGSGEAIAAGLDAQVTVGRLPGSADIISPIKNGVITDNEKCADMIDDFLDKVGISRANAVIALPSDMPEEQKDRYIDTLLDAGIKKVAVIRRELAVEKYTESRGFTDGIFCDIGGDLTEIYLIQNGSVKKRLAVNTAGNSISASVSKAAASNHKIVISRYAADNLKYEIGSACADTDNGEAEIRGAYLKTGLPATAKMTSAEIRKAISSELEKIIAAIKEIIDAESEDTAKKTTEAGVLLAGGSAFLHGIDSLIASSLGIKAKFADNILDAVACGIGVIVDNHKEYADILNYE